MVDDAFRTFLETAPDAMVVVDARGTIVAANRHVAAIFGHDAGALVGRPVEQLVPERHRARHVGHRAAFAAAPKVRAMGSGVELFGVRADGGEVPVEISLSPLAGAGGPLVVCAIRDVSARKREEQKFRDLLESAPDAMVIATGEGRIVLINAQTERMFGFARHELVGQAVEVLVPLRLRDAHVAHRARFAAEPRTRGMASGADLFGLRKDGRELPVEVSLSPLHTAGGVLVCAAIRDVSERRRAEASARLAAIVEAASEAIYRVGIDGRIETWNRAATQLYGHGADEMVGRSLATLVADPAAARALLAAVARGEPIAGLEHSRLRKDGAQVDVSMMLTPIRGEDGAPIGASIVEHDITARKRTEAVLRASLREKEVLLKEVHHRVKNNLQVVSSILNLRRLGAGRELDLVLRDMQHRIGSIALLHEKLYQSRDLAQVALDEYLRELAEQLVGAHELPGVVVDLELAVAPLRIGVDKAIPCGFIATELVSNALKYAFTGRPRGVVRVELAHDDAQVTMAIADDGVGLPAAVDPRRVESLGLQLVRTFTEQLDGELRVERSGGTRFEIRFDPRG